MSGYAALTATGRVAAGEVDTVFAPRSPRVGTCGVVLCHGSGASHEFVDLNAQPSSVRLAAALASAGIPCIAGDFGGQAWGSPTEQADITKAWQVLQGLYPGMRTDKVAVLGASMGGAAASIWAQQNPEKTACMVGLIPLLDLFDFFYRNVNGSQAEIADAWGPNLVDPRFNNGLAYNSPADDTIIGVRTSRWSSKTSYSLGTGSGLAGGPDGFFRATCSEAVADLGFELTHNPDGAGGGDSAGRVSPGDVFTVSAYLRSSAGVPWDIVWNWDDATGTSLSGGSAYRQQVDGTFAANTWRQVSFALPVVPAGAAFLRLAIYTPLNVSSQVGDTLDITAVDVRALPLEANNAANAHLAADIPLLVGYSTADQTVLPSYITDYMAQMTNPDSQAIVTDTTVGHSDAAIGGMPIPTIGQFLVAHGC